MKTIETYKKWALTKKTSQTIHGGTISKGTHNALPPHIDPNDLEAVMEYLKNQSWIGSGSGGSGLGL